MAIFVRYHKKQLYKKEAKYKEIGRLRRIWTEEQRGEKTLNMRNKL